MKINIVWAVLLAAIFSESCLGDNFYVNNMTPFNLQIQANKIAQIGQGGWVDVPAGTVGKAYTPGRLSKVDVRAIINDQIVEVDWYKNNNGFGDTEWTVVGAATITEKDVQAGSSLSAQNNTITVGGITKAYALTGLKFYCIRGKPTSVDVLNNGISIPQPK